MSVYLATKTMEAINAALIADQGATYRQLLQKVLPHIGDAYRGADLPFRSHMGASGLGKKCDRAIWYGFRWAHEPQFDGRMLRLFNRGHLEEGRIIPLFLMMGCEVYQQDANGKQYRISDAGGHLGGSGDGVIIGIPDLDPGTPALAEFKTASDKSFQETKLKGVRDTKYEHYVQINLYMGKMGLAVAVYVVVNKNTDEIYIELVPFNAEVYAKHLNRGVELVWLNEPPKRISESPGWFECRFCDYKKICHSDQAPAITCRSCKHSKPEQDGTWTCNIGPEPLVLSSLDQYKACAKYNRGF